MGEDDSHYLNTLLFSEADLHLGVYLVQRFQLYRGAQFTKNYNKILSCSKYKNLVHTTLKIDY